jgi:hypothetical protein
MEYIYIISTPIYKLHHYKIGKTYLPSHALLHDLTNLFGEPKIELFLKNNTYNSISLEKLFKELTPYRVFPNNDIFCGDLNQLKLICTNFVETHNKENKLDCIENCCMSIFLGILLLAFGIIWVVYPELARFIALILK